ncbi:MAG: isocitrate/isopropylmalate dehydrogenase family protein, partial [Planctomycetes bacterium]|nr:isocitrate/isopropylmalate dehydrogenase family protein [Planctomycetota bacterium]
MNVKKIVVIEGDGVGPEVISSAVRIIEALGPDIELVPAEMGLDSHRRNGSYLPEETLDLLGQADACLFGAITSSPDPSYSSPLLFLRRHFDLFANVRPIKRMSRDIGIVDLDIIIFRENTEGMYTGLEEWEGDSVVLKRRVSRGVCQRLVRFAVDYCEGERRDKLTCVHKANVLRRSDGMFRQVFYEEMEHHSMEKDDMLVDAAAAALVTKPGELDGIITLNLYGDILSDEAAALVGGMGFAPSANIGERLGLFEPVHGSAPDIAGKGIANPVGAMLSAAMML